MRLVVSQSKICRVRAEKGAQRVVVARVSFCWNSRLVGAAEGRMIALHFVCHFISTKGLKIFCDFMIFSTPQLVQPMTGVAS